MAITTYTDYLAAYNATLDGMQGADDVAKNTHRDCVLAAETRRDAVLNNPHSSAAETQAALDQYEADKRQCDDELRQRLKEIDDEYLPLLADIEQQARDGLAKLPALIIAWKDLLPAAEALKDVRWSSNTRAARGVPILTVQSFGELKATLEHDRWMNELMLVARADNKQLVLGRARKSLSAMATDWGPTVQTHVDDEVYLRLEQTGDVPGDTEPFRQMMGAGVIDLALLAEQEMCVPAERLIGKQRASRLGRRAEKLIQQDYCEQFPCDSFHYGNPEGRDYFDNVRGGPKLYMMFLFARNPHLTQRQQNEIGRRSKIRKQLRRPDILSDHWPRSEFYEIKPGSERGIRDGVEKIAALTVFYDEFGMRYTTGDRFQPHEYYYLTSRDFLGVPVKFYLRVERVGPGLIVYRLCARGRLSKALRRLVIVALAAIAIAVAIGEIVARPVPVPVPRPEPVPAPIPFPIPA